MTTYKEALRIIWITRCGNTNKLVEKIGKENFDRAKKEGIIITGENYPEVWKITSPGIIILRRYFSKKNIIKEWINKFL